MFDVEVRRVGGWSAAALGVESRILAIAAAARLRTAERQRPGGATSVRVMGEDGNGVRVQLGVWRIR
jgi:hypothetical protein